MIPENELHFLEDALQTARSLAADGGVMEGYLHLELGLVWAETPPLDPAGNAPGALEPWAEELIQRYRLALVQFADEYGLHWTEPPAWETVAVRDSRLLRGLARQRRLDAQSVRDEARWLRFVAREVRDKSLELRAVPPQMPDASHS